MRVRSDAAGDLERFSEVPSGRRGCRVDTCRRCRRNSARRRWRTDPSSRCRARPNQAVGARCRSRIGRSPRTPRYFRPPRAPADVECPASTSPLRPDLSTFSVRSACVSATACSTSASAFRSARVVSSRSALVMPASKPVHRGLHRALSLQQEVRPRDGQLKPCPRSHYLRRQLLDDPEQRRHLRLLEQVCLVLLDKVDRADRVVGQSMVDGLVEVAVIGEPCRRDAVESLRGGRAGHASVDDAGTRRTSGGTDTSPGHHPRAEGTGRVARRLRASPARASLRQRRRQPTAGPLGDGRRQQELAQLRFQSVDDVLRQELADHVAGTG